MEIWRSEIGKFRDRPLHQQPWLRVHARVHALVAPNGLPVPHRLALSAPLTNPIQDLLSFWCWFPPRFLKQSTASGLHPLGCTMGEGSVGSSFGRWVTEYRCASAENGNTDPLKSARQLHRKTAMTLNTVSVRNGSFPKADAVPMVAKASFRPPEYGVIIVRRVCNPGCDQPVSG